MSLRNGGVGFSWVEGDGVEWIEWIWCFGGVNMVMKGLMN